MSSQYSAHPSTVSGVHRFLRTCEGSAFAVTRCRSRIGHGHVEPSGAVPVVRSGAVVGGVGNDRAHERRRRDDAQRRRGDRRETPRRHEVARTTHLLGVRLHQVAGARVLGSQPVHHVRPGAAPVEARGATRQVGLDLLLELLSVAPELRGAVTQGVLVMEQKVESVLADGVVVAAGVQPPLEVGVERRERRTRPLARQAEALRERRRLGAERRRHLADEQPAPLVHSQRRLHEHPHRLGQRGSRVVEQRGDVLQARQRGRGLLVRGAVRREEQVVQPGEQVREPELGVRRLRPQPLEAAHRDADLVEQGGTVDLGIEVVGAGPFEGGGDRLQGGEVRGEGGGAEAAVAAVLRGDPRLRGRHRIQLPVQVEVRPLDRAEAHALCFSSRWHSSSERTRSVRFAASNRALQAPSSSGS